MLLPSKERSELRRELAVGEREGTEAPNLKTRRKKQARQVDDCAQHDVFRRPDYRRLPPVLEPVSRSRLARL